MSSPAAMADRANRDAAIALALTLPTDTVLYLLLPLHAAGFGVSLGQAGLLLAANRLVRILGYGWVAQSYERHGPRIACMAAVFGAAASSFGYALAPGLWPLLVARLVWGLSFAAMNIATQALATSEAGGAARRSGRSRAIIASGPMLGLIGGAVLAEIAGPQLVFIVLGAVALLALPFAARLPGGPGATLRMPGPRFALPSRLDGWSFVQGFALDGIFLIGLSVLAARAMPEGAALAAGAALALRYLAEVLLGPAGLGRRAGADWRRCDLARCDRRGPAARPAAAAARAGSRGGQSGCRAGGGIGPAGDLARPGGRNGASGGRAAPAHPAGGRPLHGDGDRPGVGRAGGRPAPFKRTFDLSRVAIRSRGRERKTGPGLPEAGGPEGVWRFTPDLRGTPGRGHRARYRRGRLAAMTMPSRLPPAASMIAQT